MPTIEELKAADRKLAEQRKKIREALHGKPQSDDRRARDRQRKRQDTARDKDVLIPDLPKKNRQRRKRYEKDDAKWLRFYFGPKSNCPDPFWYKFTSQQYEMIEAIGHAARWGGDQSIAASRGEGKTTLFERLLTKYALEGLIKFAVLCAATGTAAGNSLESIRDAIETNDLLLEDYPEVCIPVRALENTPNRAHYQTVSGKRLDNGNPFERVSSRFSWCGQEVVLPNVPGAPGAGAVIATRGLDAAVRGLKRKGRRPDIVGVDDPDTEETARSEEQAKKLEDRIDKALGGLGGQQKNVARVMLTTLQNRICVSYKFTDPSQKSSWKGKRFRFLVKPPDRTDLWDEYIQMRQACFQQMEDGESLDPFARGAHKFYLHNRKKMDAGAIVANPHRFNGEKLPDGSKLEVSALQRYYNEVARIGPEAVATEYDNDPPEESGPVESGITAYRIQRQLSGYPRRIVPPGCTIVTQGIDVRKVALHWVVRAWKPDGTGYTIDYGIQEVLGTIRGSDEGLEMALMSALRARLEFVASNPYQTIGGGEMPMDLTLVDAGWQTETIYHCCREMGRDVRPSMGFGKSSGCVQTRFSDVTRATRDKKPGDGWFLSRKPKSIWLVCMDADRWKAWEHDRWMTPSDRPGTMFLYGEPGDGKRLSYDEKTHFSYSKHLTSEVEVEEPVKGVLVRRWKNKSDTNHYFDASYMSSVAANMKGVRLLKSSKSTGQAQPRRTLSQMAGKA